VSNGEAANARRNERRGRLIGLPEDDGWVDVDWDGGASRPPEGRWSGEGLAGWALDAGRPPESGGGGGRGRRGSRDSGEGRDEKKGEADGEDAGRPEDRPWTPIPRQAKSAERSLIPPQRRLKKTSRSA
jgi:hypothetical protein